MPLQTHSDPQIMALERAMGGLREMYPGDYYLVPSGMYNALRRTLVNQLPDQLKEGVIRATEKLPDLQFQGFKIVEDKLAPTNIIQVADRSGRVKKIIEIETVR